MLVLEGSVLPGPDFITYGEYVLDLLRDDPALLAIPDARSYGRTGWVTPAAASRLTLCNQPTALAIWGRAWAGYDDDLA
jgi:hypothetical protein